MGMGPHPYADLFPMMKGEQFRELVESVRVNGLEHPIVTYEGQILDGRNRHLACANLQIKPRYVAYKGDDPLGYVVRSNLTRRHLTRSQRAMVAAELANLEHGGDRRSDQAASLPDEPAISQAAAAEMMDVSERSVRSAKKVKDSGDEETIAAVKSGEMTVSAAAKKVAPEPEPTEDRSEKWRRQFMAVFNAAPSEADREWVREVVSTSTS